MAWYHPFLFALDAERAHRLTIRALALRRGTAFTPEPVTDPRLACRVAGIAFPNPVGLAAGADKDAEAIHGFFGLGFGSVEVGTLTPLPQGGNPKPRLFRLREDAAVINRMGFNNGGLTAALPRIRAARACRRRPARGHGGHGNGLDVRPAGTSARPCAGRFAAQPGERRCGAGRR